MSAYGIWTRQQFDLDTEAVESEPSTLEFSGGDMPRSEKTEVQHHISIFS